MTTRTWGELPPGSFILTPYEAKQSCARRRKGAVIASLLTKTGLVIFDVTPEGFTQFDGTPYFGVITRPNTVKLVRDCKSAGHEFVAETEKMGEVVRLWSPTLIETEVFIHNGTASVIISGRTIYKKQLSTLLEENPRDFFNVFPGMSRAYHAHMRRAFSNQLNCKNDETISNIIQKVGGL